MNLCEFLTFYLNVYVIVITTDSCSYFPQTIKNIHYY